VGHGMSGLLARLGFPSPYKCSNVHTLVILHLQDRLNPLPQKDLIINRNFQLVYLCLTSFAMMKGLCRICQE
jgi:hypothetical protein